MSASVSQEVAALEAEPFRFSLLADEGGIVDLVFKKDVAKLFSTLITAMAFINNTFDEPLATTGDFIRFLATVADETKEKADARRQEESGKSSAE